MGTMDFSQFDEGSVISRIDEACDRWPDRACFVFEREETSYRTVQQRSIQVANQLIAAGFQKGMRGAIFSPNDPEAFVAALGIIRAGGIWLPINPRNSIADNCALLEKFGCDFLFHHSAFSSAIDAIRASCSKRLGGVCIDGGEGSDPSMEVWLDGVSTVDPAVPVGPDDIVTTPMTGGTTGLPKAVAISNRNLASIMGWIEDVFGSHAPRNLAAAPMTHVGGRIVLTMMVRGGTSVILSEISPRGILEAIAEHRITDVFLPPTAIYALLAQPDLDDYDTSSLEHIMYGSAPMSIEKLKQAIAAFGPVMTGGFGQTEAPMSISLLLPEDHFVGGEIAPDARLRSVGRATPVSTLAIMDDDGKLLQPGEVGEIVVQGPFVSEGYFENPEATAQVRRDGWHLTGDVGYLDEDGFLYIVDRKKDMIITGGFNVYSTEVERVVSALPGVRDNVVIGIPDEKWGEAVKAVVELDADAQVDAETIIEACKAQLGSVKAPKSVDFVDALPKNANGKLLKRQVRDRYWKGAGRRV